MYHEYPYTTYFHDIDKMCNACNKAGYRLEVSGDYLKLIDEKGNVISNVKISYAEKALTDVDGTPIRAYIVSAAAGESTLVFQHGDDSVTTITVPYATKAKEDVYGVDLASYLKTVQVSGNKIHFTNGDGTSYELTMPYAIKASEDENGKKIDTYAATLATDGNELVLKDSENRELARLTVNYALRAFADDDGDPIDSTYGHNLTKGTTTIGLRAKDGTVLNEITVPYATKALTDNEGNKFISDYADKIVVDGDGRRIGVEAHDGTRLATITVPFATLATDATNAIENVQIVGDQLIFTTHGGVNYSITVPYALKAQKDDNGNTIKTTYIANVDNDAKTGALRFYDALGNIIVTLTPTVTQATEDNLGNVISDYIKAVVADPQSDNVVFTHGDGDTDAITVPYSLRAWKDSLGQPIQNTYLTLITIEPDEDDPKILYLAGWNGDTPKAKVFAIRLNDYLGKLAFKDSVSATYTPAGTVTSTASGTAVTLGTKTIKVIDKVGTLPSKASDSFTPASHAADTFVAPSCTYNGDTQTITLNAGSFTSGAFSGGSFTEGAFSAGTLPTTKNATVADGTATVTDPTVTSTFAGTEATITST